MCTVHVVGVGVGGRAAKGLRAADKEWGYYAQGDNAVNEHGVSYKILPTSKVLTIKSNVEKQCLLFTEWL